MTPAIGLLAQNIKPVGQDKQAGLPVVNSSGQAAPSAPSLMNLNNWRDAFAMQQPSMPASPYMQQMMVGNTPTYGIDPATFPSPYSQAQAPQQDPMSGLLGGQVSPPGLGGPTTVANLLNPQTPMGLLHLIAAQSRFGR